MSQDTHLFSVRRNRETLGGLNFNSAIPQPASALKRSNSISGLKDPQFTSQPSHHGRSMSSSRMSLAPPGRPQQPMFHRSSSGNLQEQGRPSTVQRTSSSMSAQGPRMSYAPASMMTPHAQAPISASTSAPRSSNVWSRPSGSGVGPHQSFFSQAPLPAGPPRDPRPLKDASYRARIAQELLDYLAQNNYELDMKRQLSQNTLKSPQQKDFDCIFQWLYHRLDPAYRFQKSMDNEVPVILRQLRYPFEKNITKSQITAVGGQNWSTFLGMLHWLMQFIQMLEKFSTGEYDRACAEAGVDVSSDRIIFRFLSGAYRDWLQVEPSEDDQEDPGDKVVAPHVEAMAEAFEHGNREYLEELQMLEAENQALKHQIDELERTMPDIAEVETASEALKSDIDKFEDYNVKCLAKTERYTNMIEVLRKEISDKEKETADALTERDELQHAVDRQGITTSQIDHMNTERERLQKGVETATTRLDELRKKLADKELETGAKLEDLERAIDKYNSLAHNTGLIPSSARNAHGEDLELRLTIDPQPAFSSSQLAASSLLKAAASSDADPPSRLLSDPTSGYQAHEILSSSPSAQLRPTLSSLRKETNNRRNEAKLQDEESHRLLDEISEAIEDKRNEIEALENRVRMADAEHEKTREVTGTRKAESDAQIEKMERELGRLREGVKGGGEVMEQREMNAGIEFEQLTLQANAIREELHTETERMLNDIIKFKVHVQKSLEDYEGFVVEEVEVELGGGDADDADDDADEHWVHVHPLAAGENGSGFEG